MIHDNFFLAECTLSQIYAARVIQRHYNKIEILIMYGTSSLGVVRRYKLLDLGVKSYFVPGKVMYYDLMHDGNFDCSAMGHQDG